MPHPKHQSRYQTRRQSSVDGVGRTDRERAGALPKGAGSSRSPVGASFRRADRHRTACPACKRSGELGAPRAADPGAAPAHALARKSHQLPAADADLLAVTRRTPSSRFDVGSATPSASFGPCALSQRHLLALATKLGEISALVPLHRGFDRLKINRIGLAVASSAPSQPVKITVQRYLCRLRLQPARSALSVRAPRHRGISAPKVRRTFRVTSHLEKLAEFSSMRRKLVRFPR